MLLLLFVVVMAGCLLTSTPAHAISHSRQSVPDSQPSPAADQNEAAAASSVTATRIFYGEGFGFTRSDATNIAWLSILSQAQSSGYGNCFVTSQWPTHLGGGWWYVMLAAQCTLYGGPPSQPHGPTQMRSALSGMCAAVGGNSTQQNMHFIQYKCDRKLNKSFTFTRAPGSSDAWIIRVRSTGMCVVPENYSTANHTVVVQKDCNESNAASQWRSERSASGTYAFRNAASPGRCLGVGWDQTYSGQPLDLATCGAPGQQWNLQVNLP
ncbi:RICIN domain-containing protein [Microbacterium sp.]|uniref:RICIN domain-containing protein n=1 Tax=Microbacterium sp. TaxID=51671 RepID=UPI003A859AA8